MRTELLCFAKKWATDSLTVAARKELFEQSNGLLSHDREGVVWSGIFSHLLTVAARKELFEQSNGFPSHDREGVGSGYRVRECNAFRSASERPEFLRISSRVASLRR